MENRYTIIVRGQPGKTLYKDLLRICNQMSPIDEENGAQVLRIKGKESHTVHIMTDDAQFPVHIIGFS